LFGNWVGSNVAVPDSHQEAAQSSSPPSSSTEKASLHAAKLARFVIHCFFNPPVLGKCMGVWLHGM